MSKIFSTTNKMKVLSLKTPKMHSAIPHFVVLCTCTIYMQH